MTSIDQSPRRRWTWAVFGACLALTLVSLKTSGALDSDLGGDPDEAAHAVTSLMVRDFMAGGWRQPPMVFANRYYADFPKVALGHYPPGYYLVSGLWLLPFASIKSLFVLQAVLSASLGALLYRVASKFVSLPAATAAGLLIAAMPLSLKQIQFVMSDTMLALLCLLSVTLWSAFMNRPTVRRALGFGGVAAAAILTKGSAMGLCAIPPLATALASKLQLIKRLPWWLSALPVVAFAGPWMIGSARITAEGMTHQPIGEFFSEAVFFYGKSIPQTLGWVYTILSMAGLVWLFCIGCAKSRRAGTAASLTGLLMGMVAIMVVVPAGLTSRYILPILPVLLLAAVLAADKICARLPKLQWLALFFVIVGGFAFVAKWPIKSVNGFTTAVMRSGIPPLEQKSASRWLIASDPRGEGAIIAAAAFNCPRRSPSLLRVYRGSKELASSDWMGRDYQSPFADEAAILQHLDKLQVSRVLVDLSGPAAKRLPHELLLHTAMQSAIDRWALDFEQPITRRPGETGVMRVYQRISPATSEPPN